MLDFYLLADDRKAPEDPAEGLGDRIGRIDDQTFARLKRKNVIPEGFAYGSDFRWGAAMVQQILADNQHSADSDVQQVLQLLKIAQGHGCGLFAFCD